MSLRILFSLVALSMVASCADKTAVHVTVRSSVLMVGEDVDNMVVSVRSGDSTASEDFALVGDWPHTFTVLPGAAGGPADVEVRIEARLGDEVVIERLIKTRFGDGSEVRVVVELEAACLGVTCGSEQDCQVGVCCIPDGPSSMGDCPDASDAGCTPTGPETTCNGMDDDCDTRIDEGLPCIGAIVISEVATAGAISTTDEFIELYNRTDSEIDLTGVQLDYGPPGGGLLSLTTLSGSIRPHGFFLATSSDYAGVGGVSGDASELWRSEEIDINDLGGHIRLVRTVVLDVFGWGTATAPEDSAAPALVDPTIQSYERKASLMSTTSTMGSDGAEDACGHDLDTEHNDRDFVVRLERLPQSRGSGLESPCP